MQALQIERIEQGFKQLQEDFADVEVIQSIDMLIQKLNVINAQMAFGGEQMAISKKLFNDAKLKAYTMLQDFYKTVPDKKFSPLLAKDFVSSQCSTESYNYDLAERYVRALVHISSNIVTSISGLKEQLKLEMQTERVPQNYNQ